MNGTVAKGFEPVAAAFQELLEDGRETGASVAAYVGGELVVDLWGGWAAPGKPWQADTLTTVFSAGKPVAALAVLKRVADGLIGLDEPVQAYWPAFRHDSGTVRHALAHQLGLPAIAEPLTAAEGLDWARCTGAIFDSPLEWEPGTAVGEHALTYGNILGAILRGATGESVGDVVRGFGLDVHFGVPAHERGRCAELEHATPDWPRESVSGHGELWARALGNPAGLLDLAVLNGDAWRGGELPAVNLHATARGLAGVYHALPRLLPPELLAEALAPQAVGVDRLLEEDAVWTLGWRRDEDWVGMGGIGGSSAGGRLDDPDGYRMAYVTRRLADHDRGNLIYDTLEAGL
ncbi:serine hydrolase domain-containing protein [Dactylosporangium sp. CS-047395]|uniref:serine hydrolase domain-containing protein n=1 Tax=Dactylosporangium sp. CS-047395 TaxID=3239936 RepID=UPI003D9209E8